LYSTVKINCEAEKDVISMKFSLESLIFVGKKTLNCNETRTHKQIDRQKQNICNKEFIYKWKGKTFYLEEAKLAWIKEYEEDD